MQSITILLQRVCEDKNKFLDYPRLEYEELNEWLRIIEGYTNNESDMQVNR